jgi:amphi-Trp domain-containing protein
MGSKSNSMKQEEVRLAYDAGVLLKQIADGLALQKFECQSKDGTFVIEVPNQIKVKFSVKEKLKKDGTKTKVKVEMGWFTPQAPSPEAPAQEVDVKSEVSQSPEVSEIQETVAEKDPETGGRSE